MTSGYIRPSTKEEYRNELLKLMQGEAWRRLCTEKHVAVRLITEAARSLSDEQAHPESLA
jgi:hypothetical protein